MLTQSNFFEDEAISKVKVSSIPMRQIHETSVKDKDKNKKMATS